MRGQVCEAYTSILHGLKPCLVSWQVQKHVRQMVAHIAAAGRDCSSLSDDSRVAALGVVGDLARLVLAAAEWAQQQLPLLVFAGRPLFDPDQPLADAGVGAEAKAELAHPHALVLRSGSAAPAACGPLTVGVDAGAAGTVWLSVAADTTVGGLTAAVRERKDSVGRGAQTGLALGDDGSAMGSPGSPGLPPCRQGFENPGAKVRDPPAGEQTPHGGTWELGKVLEGGGRGGVPQVEWVNNAKLPVSQAELLKQPPRSVGAGAAGCKSAAAAMPRSITTGRAPAFRRQHTHVHAQRQQSPLPQQQPLRVRR
eukprot:gene7523-63211_t